MRKLTTGRSELARESKSKSKSLASALTLALLTLATLAQAEISCPPIFTDHMVLQREKPIAIWGTADPSEAVTVTFADQSLKTNADQSGNWSLKLAPLEASFTPRILTIAGENELAFQDVLVGEVWLCSGQSNMDKPLGEKRGQKPTLGYPEVLEEGNLPALRLFRVPNNVKIENPELELQWVPCSSEILDPMQFSAAGFHFGQKLLKELDVPIGLIHSAFGGTMIEAWIPESSYLENEVLKPLLHHKYHSWIDGVQATELYESMIKPLVPYSLRGFIWYQGESNLMNGDAEIYKDKMLALVDAWRTAWQAPETPFYFAQISPFTYSEWIGHKSLTLDALPLFWEVQLSIADPEQNIEIIPTIDLIQNVRDIHPINKRDVGYRFASLALSKTYKKRLFAAELPKLIKTTLGKNGAIKLSFSRPLSQSEVIADGELGAFEIAGDDQVYHPAKSEWRKGKVTLSSASVPQPQYVRYAWDEKSKPPQAESNRLPLYPFRTDTSPRPVLQPQFHKALRISLKGSESHLNDWNRLDTASGTLASKTIEGITITLEQTNGQKDHKISIEGLSNNPHTLITYHADSSPNYQEFYTERDQTNTFTFGETVESLTAIVIDAPNPSKQTRSPYPPNRGAQTVINSEPLILSWQPAPDSASYIIYFNQGEDRDATAQKIKKAGRSSSTFLKAIDTTRQAIKVNDSIASNQVAWRVDSIDANGTLTRGETWTLTLSIER